MEARVYSFLIYTQVVAFSAKIFVLKTAFSEIYFIQIKLLSTLIFSGLKLLNQFSSFMIKYFSNMRGLYFLLAHNFSFDFVLLIKSAKGGDRNTLNPKTPKPQDVCMLVGNK